MFRLPVMACLLVASACGSVDETPDAGEPFTLSQTTLSPMARDIFDAGPDAMFTNTITLTHTGMAHTYALTAADHIGLDASDCNQELSDGESCNFLVTWKPTAVGSHMTSVMIDGTNALAVDGEGGIRVRALVDKDGRLGEDGGTFVCGNNTAQDSCTELFTSPSVTFTTALTTPGTWDYWGSQCTAGRPDTAQCTDFCAGSTNTECTVDLSSVSAAAGHVVLLYAQFTPAS